MSSHSSQVSKKSNKPEEAWSNVALYWDYFAYQMNEQFQVHIALPEVFFKWFEENANCSASFRKFVFFYFDKIVTESSDEARQNGALAFNRWLDRSTRKSSVQCEINVLLDSVKDADDEILSGNTSNADLINTSSLDESIFRLLNNIKLNDDEGVYSLREDKSESPTDFLLRVYRQEIDQGNITYSKLRLIDRSLWDALRRWARVEGNDISSLLSLGRTTRGRVPTHVPSTALDPSNPIHALALKQLRQLELNRARVRRHRQNALAPK